MPHVWQIDEAVSKRSVQYFGSIDEPWPDVTLKFTLRRVSFVDQKVAVLPLTGEESFFRIFFLSKL